MKKLFVKTLFVFALAATCQLKAQVTPHTTADYQLSGYPKMVRYMKFESDTAKVHIISKIYKS